MKITETALIDAFIVEVTKYGDKRGFFLESFNQKNFSKLVGTYDFVQDNHSKSSKGVLRGLHYQMEHPQGKLVRCIYGSVFDVIVDLRISSKTFGMSLGITLDRPDLLLWIPPGFAHGFYSLTDNVEFLYKTTDYYYPEDERTLLWNDQSLNIDWGLDVEPIISEKDKNGKTFEECYHYE